MSLPKTFVNELLNVLSLTPSGEYHPDRMILLNELTAMGYRGVRNRQAPIRAFVDTTLRTLIGNLQQHTRTYAYMPADATTAQLDQRMNELLDMTADDLAARRLMPTNLRETIAAVGMLRDDRRAAFAELIQHVQPEPIAPIVPAQRVAYTNERRNVHTQEELAEVERQHTAQLEQVRRDAVAAARAEYDPLIQFHYRMMHEGDGDVQQHMDDIHRLTHEMTRVWRDTVDREHQRLAADLDRMRAAMTEDFTVQPNEEYSANKDLLQTYFEERMTGIRQVNEADLAELRVTTAGAASLQLRPIEDEESFNEELHRIRRGFRATIDMTEQFNDEPYQAYYYNQITSIDDIIDALHTTLDRETQLGHMPVKLSVDYGVILEEHGYTMGGNHAYTYHSALPNIRKSHISSVPMVIKNAYDANLFIDTIISHIKTVTEITYETTKCIPVAIFSAAFYVYRLHGAGACVPGLREHIRLRSLEHTSSEYNICVFIALSYRMRPTKLATNIRIAHAKELYASFYKIDITSQRTLTPHLRAYKGFNFASEIDAFMQHFRYNVDVYHYDASREQYKYSLQQHYRCNVAYETLSLLNIGLGDTIHTMHVRDPELLTQMLICPHCKTYARPVSNKNHTREHFNNHVEKCKANGGVVQRRVKLDKCERPYCPAIFGNKRTEYLLAHGRMDEWRPTKSFITFDFETVDRRYEGAGGTAKMELLSVLEPISIAVTYVDDGEIIDSEYFDIRQGNFIVAALTSMFTHANTMTLNDQRRITLLGWNSARFDNTFIFRHLNTSDWIIKNILGSTLNAKFVDVYHKELDITIRLIDAQCYAGKMELKTFVRDYSSGEVGVDLSKGVFPYEAITYDTYDSVLSMSEPFAYEDFYSSLRGCNMLTAEQYADYVVEAGKYATRWDYLRYYNIQDTVIMVQPLLNLIDSNAQYYVDMLHGVSHAGNAAALKFMSCYFPSLFDPSVPKSRDFNMDADYTDADQGSNFVEGVPMTSDDDTFCHESEGQVAGRFAQDTRQNVLTPEELAHDLQLGDEFKTLEDTLLTSTCASTRVEPVVYSECMMRDRGTDYMDGDAMQTVRDRKRIDYSKGFYEYVPVSRVRPYFECDDVTTEDELVEFIGVMDRCVETFGAYTMGGYTTDARIADKYRLKYQPYATKVMSIRVVYYEVCVDAYDFMLFITSAFGREVFGKHYDGAVYKLTKEHGQLFRHVLSPKYEQKRILGLCISTMLDDPKSLAPELSRDTYDDPEDEEYRTNYNKVLGLMKYKGHEFRAKLIDAQHRVGSICNGVAADCMLVTPAGGERHVDLKVLYPDEMSAIIHSRTTPVSSVSRVVGVDEARQAFTSAADVIARYTVHRFNARTDTDLKLYPLVKSVHALTGCVASTVMLILHLRRLGLRFTVNADEMLEKDGEKMMTDGREWSFSYLSKRWGIEFGAPVYSASMSYTLTRPAWEYMVKGYMYQDTKAGRDTTGNVTSADYAWAYNLFTGCCVLCNGRFTYDNKPSLDRKDNSIGHTRDNCQPAHVYCNSVKADNDEKLTKLRIQMRLYAIKYKLPMTLADERVYKLLNACKTGGLSNVMNRVNIAGETTIKTLSLVDGRVRVTDTGNVMTHVLGVDFNSLYPSCYAAADNHYGKPMLMPGKVLYYTDKPSVMRRVIEARDPSVKYVVSAKLSMKPEYMNKCLFFPPIIRNLTYDIRPEVIGDFTYDAIQRLETGAAGSKTVRERKLTQLLSTHGEFMSFTDEYINFLVDTCGIVIDDVQEMVVFTANDAFKTFVTSFASKRIEAIAAGNTSRSNFTKMTLNSSYGHDSMNTEKYARTKICDRSQAFLHHLYPSFRGTTSIADGVYAVELMPDSYECRTCLHSAVFTLDHAKVWYLKFVYDFIMRCCDLSRIMYGEGDTDSLYWIIAGDPAAGISQGLEHIITDHQFYYANVYKWFPDPSKGVADAKKLLGLCIEKEGTSLIALSPKCYTLELSGGKSVYKNKGVSTKVSTLLRADGTASAICYDDYLTVSVGEIKYESMSTNLRSVRVGDEYQMMKIRVVKDSLTGIHTKVIVTSDGSTCIPFIHGLTARDYTLVGCHE